MKLFSELKRRNVFRVAAAYLVIAWLIVQVVSILSPMFEVPVSFQRGIVLLLLVAFIPVLFFTWAYEITEDGIKKEAEIERDASFTALTAKKLNIITLLAVVAAGGMFVFQQMNSSVSSHSSVLESQAEVESVKGVSADLEKEVVTGDVIAAAAVDNKSVAVLPFANMANNAENEPFTLGLHDDLLTHLSKISALKVISRTSVMEYKNTTKKIKQIAKELGVANILEGGVQRAGNKIRLNVQLIDAATDDHIWAEIYDSELTTDNIFEIQTEISEKIAAALKAQLTAAEIKSIAEKPTDNLAAYNAYLAARQLAEERTGPAVKQALALYERATELDPNYALAYVGQATAWSLLTGYSDLPHEEMIIKGLPLIDKALSLNPLSAEAHTIKAFYLGRQGKYAEAEESYKYSLSLNPNYASTYQWYGSLLRVNLNRPEEAIVMNQKAAELDPLSNVILINLAWGLRSLGRLHEAMEQFTRVHERDPNFPGAVNGLAWVNDDLGNYAQAVIEQTKAISLDKGNLSNRLWLLLHYLNMNAITSAKATLTTTQEMSPNYSQIPYYQSLLEMVSGDYSTSVERYQNIVNDDPENPFNASTLALFNALNGDCSKTIMLWQQLSPERFASSYLSNASQVYDDLVIAWCLKQADQVQASERLLASIDTNVKKVTNATEGTYYKAASLAIQGQSAKAAQAYAEVIRSKRNRGWHWVDHLPYYTDMRQEPVFIQAREQLMQELAEQRQLLNELRAKEGLK